MMIKHERKFLPVGHGAFFIERLYVDDKRILTAVYDCGDSHGGSLVQEYANQEFNSPTEPKEKIDILFISHFDQDHVNGLECLKQFIHKRTRVFLPYFYDNLVSVYNRDKRVGIEFVIRFLTSSGIVPIKVRSQSEEGRRQVIDVDEYNFEQNGYVIESGQPIVKRESGHVLWRYVPFNLFNEEKFYTQFEEEIIKSPNWDSSKLQNPKNWSPEDVRSLRKLYGSFSGQSINDTSLIVLSDRYFGPPCPNSVSSTKADYLHRLIDCFPPSYSRGHIYHRFRYHFHCRYCFPPSCLYTGDTVLKRGVKGAKYVGRYEELLKELIQHTWKIGLMQLPHHGSGNNINMSVLCDSVSSRLFCNYSTTDVNNKVFFLKPDNLKTVWKCIIKVTEEDDSGFEETHYFKV